MGILTTSTGSLPKSRALRAARWRFSEGEIERPALREAEAQALRAAVSMQERLGLDQLVDGQLDRSDMITEFAERLQGMEIGGLVRCWGNRYYRAGIIEDAVERPAPLTVEGWKAAQALTAKPLRAVLTGPYTLMDWSFDQHYGSREACCLALAEVVRQEAVDLVAAGAKEIQLDEPAIGSRPEEMDLVREAVVRVTGELTGARTWLHLCYGDLRPVIGSVMTLPADVLLLELTQSRFAVLEMLGDLPDGKLLGAGVVDPLTPEVETVDEVKARIERVLERLPPERLWVAPDSGLRSLTPDQAEAKLQALATAAATF